MAVLRATRSASAVLARGRSELFAWYNDPEIVAPYDRFTTDTYDEFVRSIEAAPADPASLAPRFAVVRRTEGDMVGIVGHYRAHPVPRRSTSGTSWVAGRPAGTGSGARRSACSSPTCSRPRRSSGSARPATSRTCRRSGLLEGLGFRREGTMRSILFHHGRWHDVHVYGVTRRSGVEGARSSSVTRAPPSPRDVGGTSVTAPSSPVERRWVPPHGQTSSPSI